MVLDVKKIKDDASKEYKEEREKEAKEKVKTKLKDLSRASKVVVNIERELEDLYDELSQDK